MNYSLLIISFFYFYLFSISFIGIFTTRKMRKLLLFLQAISISCFYGFRDIRVGGDTIVYVNNYLTREKDIEIGFQIINKLIFNVFGDNWRIFLLVICFVTAFSLAIFYLEFFGSEFQFLNISYTFLYTLPYTILMSINVIRYGLALSLFLLGFTLYFKKRSKIGIMLILISCTIHYAFFVIFIGIIIYFYLSLKYFLAIMITLILLILNDFGIIYKLFLFLPESYIKNKIFAYSNLKNEIIIFYKFTFYFLNYLIMVFYSKKIKNKYYNYLRKFIEFIILSAAIVYSSNKLSNRLLISIEYIIPIIYLYPIKYIKGKKIYFTGFCIIFIIYFIFTITSKSMMINFLL